MNLKEIQAGIGWLETDIKREDMYISALREFEYQESEVSEAKAHKTALNTALAALREQAEREKGCSMCEHDVMDGNPIVAKHADGYTTTTTGVVSFGANLVAKFCPMCGKRLEEKA